VLPDGSQVCIFPNSFQKNNAIKAGQEVVVPPTGDKTFDFIAREPAGREGLLAIVMKTPTSIEELKPENLNRAQGPRSVSRVALKQLIVVDGMGGKPEDVNKPALKGPLDVSKEKERMALKDPDQFDKRMKNWASATVEIQIVPAK